MEDNTTLGQIKNLTKMEEKLYGKEDLTDEDVKRLHRIQSELEQCWDYLRQRRARRDVGENPDSANIRSIDDIHNDKR